MSKKFIILLAEDDPDDRQLFQLALKRVDGVVDVVEVHDGPEVIAYLKGKDRFKDRAEFPFPNLLLLDFVMPKMDAPEVLKWVRDQSEFKDLPVIVWSGSDRPGQSQAVVPFGAEYVRKAPDFNMTMELARRIVHKAIQAGSANGRGSH
jgi:two-component system, response regulator